MEVQRQVLIIAALLALASATLPPCWASQFQIQEWANLDMPINRMAADPSRPYVYAVSTNNNRLFAVNTVTGSVDHSIFIGSKPTDLSIDATTDRLYVANWGSTEIGVVDLASFTRLSPIVVATTPYRVDVGRAGRLYYLEEDQWVDGHVVDTVNRQEIGSFWVDYQGDIETNSAGTILYHGNSGLSSSETRSFDISKEPVTPLQTVGSYEYPYGYAQNNLFLTSDDQYLVYRNWLIDANNLHHIIGTYGELVYAATGHAEYVFGSSNIWNGQEFTVVEPMPVAATLMAVSKDSKWLYLYDAANQRIALVQTPVPEPGSVFVLVSAMGVLVMTRGRRRNSCRPADCS